MCYPWEYFALTIHKCYDINRFTVYKLYSVILFLISKEKVAYEHSITHKVYKNKLNQNFFKKRANQKKYIDFTYLFLTNSRKLYNYTIIVLHDYSIVARQLIYKDIFNTRKTF